MFSVTFLVLFVTVSIHITIVSSKLMYLPSLYWDQRNPLFKCNDPLIMMSAETQLDIHCARPVFHNYIRGELVQSTGEFQMVQVKDEEHYEKCNLTDSSPRLYCQEKDIPFQCNKDSCSPFYNIYAGTPGYKDVAGKTYYFIGTDKTGSTAPCQGANNKPKMKFKVHICTEEETAAGLCEPCATQACFYQKCSEECSDWLSNEKVYKDVHGNCYHHQTKTCKNLLTLSSTNKSREIQVNCPLPQCEDWEDIGLTTYKNNGCVMPQERKCTLEGVEKIEKQERPVMCPATTCHPWRLEQTVIRKNPKSCYKVEKQVCYFKVQSKDNTFKNYENVQEVNITCPKPKSCPPVTTVTSEKNTSKKPEKSVEVSEKEGAEKYIYIIIGASVASLIIGMMLGYCLTRFCQGRREPIEVVKTVEKVIPIEGIGPIMSYDNKNFQLDPVLEDNQSFTMGDIAFIPTTQEVGTTKRQVMVARSVSFYNPDVATGHYYRKDTKETKETKGHQTYRPPRTIQESRRNVMRHPSATSKSVLIRNHSDATERPRSDSDTSVFNLKAPGDMVSEEV